MIISLYIKGRKEMLQQLFKALLSHASKNVSLTLCMCEFGVSLKAASKMSLAVCGHISLLIQSNEIFSRRVQHGYAAGIILT